MVRIHLQPPWNNKHSTIHNHPSRECVWVELLSGVARYRGGNPVAIKSGLDAVSLVVQRENRSDWLTLTHDPLLRPLTSRGGNVGEKLRVLIFAYLSNWETRFLKLSLTYDASHIDESIKWTAKGFIHSRPASRNCCSSPFCRSFVRVSSSAADHQQPPTRSGRGSIHNPPRL